MSFMMPCLDVCAAHRLGAETYEKYAVQGPRRLWAQEAVSGGMGLAAGATAARNLRFLCVHFVHFVLAAHVVALNCGKLSTQQAAWHADWKDSQAFASILDCALQSFRIVLANLCLILAIRPMRAFAVRTHTANRIKHLFGHKSLSVHSPSIALNCCILPGRARKL